MKELPKNAWIRLIIEVVVTILVAMILFPLFDYFYSLIINTEFVFSIHDHIQEAILFGVIFGFITWLFGLAPTAKND